MEQNSTCSSDTSQNVQQICILDNDGNIAKVIDKSELPQLILINDLNPALNIVDNNSQQIEFIINSVTEVQPESTGIKRNSSDRIPVNKKKVCKSRVKVKDIWHKDITNLCTFCLKPGKLLLSRYQLAVSETFKYISLKFNIIEKGPQRMCQNCADRIKEISAFIDNFKGYDPFLYENLDPNDNDKKMNRYKNLCSFCLSFGLMQPLKLKVSMIYYHILCRKEVDLLIKEKLPEKLCRKCSDFLETIDEFVHFVQRTTNMILDKLSKDNALM